MQCIEFSCLELSGITFVRTHKSHRQRGSIAHTLSLSSAHVGNTVEEDVKLQVIHPSQISCQVSQISAHGITQHDNG